MKLKIAIAGFFFLVSAASLFAQEDAILRNAKEINSPQLDFSPVPFKNGILFTSSKSDRFLQCPPENAGDFTDIFFAPLLSDGSFGPKELLQGELNGKYNDGVAAVLPGADKLIITRNNTNGKNAADIIDLKLYALDWTEVAWGNSVSLPFNSEDWSTAHPAMSQDGSLLVFSSNRPGSVNGSMDLWFSTNENGQWSEPVNAGPGINTAGNELFPSLDELNNLFFSSNGHGGAGGLDLFAARRGNSGEWELVGNLGAPFSQAGDDVSFFPMENGTRGYYSGSRADGAGLDDIYSWTYDPLREVVVAVEDSLSGERLPGARVDVSAIEFGSTLDKLFEIQFQNGPLTLIANEEGMVSMKVSKGSSYEFVCSEEGYISRTRRGDYAGLMAEQPYVIKLPKATYEADLTVMAIDADSKLFLPFSKITLRNESTGETTELTADSLGQLNIRVDCSSQYSITASKASWQDNTVTWTGVGLVDCGKGRFQVTIPLKRIREIVLEPIFFNFDKHYIRSPDAKASLDTLVTILRRYPSLRVRLEAHCDARGSNKYNDDLANRRSNSAKNYLLSRGIAANRLGTQGFGEDFPINNCKDRIRCSEISHQLNRRVDVIPLEHEERGVVFKTRMATQMQVRSDRQ